MAKEITLVKSSSVITIGRQGEGNVREIQFNIADWVKLYGDGTVQLLHRRSADTTPYPVNVTLENMTTVQWLVTQADTAYSGSGRAEMRYYVGDMLKVSKTWETIVSKTMGGGTPAEAPEAQQGWVDKVLQAGTDAENAALRAENAEAQADQFTQQALEASEVAREAAERAELAAAQGANITYTEKDKIAEEIEAGLIPKDSIIITSDFDEAEMFFYDTFGDMKMIAERNHFETMELAQAWVGKYNCAGNIISVHSGNEWTPYIVLQDNTLKPLDEPGGGYRIIDGGDANGVD